MLDERQRLIRLCASALEKQGLNTNAQYKERLKKELKSIDQQGEYEYLLNLYDRFKKEKLIFPKNENNLLVAYLLNLVRDFDIEQDVAFFYGETPDIDVDYVEPVRNYLKREWAAKTFGKEYVCEIGTYGTSGIKMAILDMARVYSLDHDEIQAITKKIRDKDDDGKDLEWDKALEIYPEFAEYCKRNPEAAEAARLLLDRNRSGGVHAGGLVISSKPLDGFVPLEVRGVKKENPAGVICTAWTEGLSAQDLQPVGLIKFDLLVIGNLTQIALACDLIKKRHGLQSICALPGESDWSDISYLNDPESLAIANAADLKCIFQFDGDGMRKLVKKSGITRFDDLPALSALYRPGPLGLGMDVHYANRKKNNEAYDLHPVLKPILDKTYGVILYQEQIMEILRIVGRVPDMHTEKVRKAISKKKIEGFIKYKEAFIKNGQQVLNASVEYVNGLWDQIQSFAEYGFNSAHAYAYAYISARLLWLKAHYPLEFYTAILMCESADEKFREYKLDARNHGIEICPVHINKSKENFHIEDNKIYFGFSNIKGVGEAVAERIVAGQPYKNFADFLDRFGTDASVLKALVALGVFEEKQDRLTLRKYVEFYKDRTAKRRQRAVRHQVSLAKWQDDLKNLLLTEISETDSDFAIMCQFTKEAEELREKRFFGLCKQVPFKYRGEDRFREVLFTKLLQGVVSRYEGKISDFERKEKDDEEYPLTLEQFNSSISIKLSKEEEKLLKEELWVNGRKGFPEAEKAYYGFQWTHLLEGSPDYEGYTIDSFLEEAEQQGLEKGPIEVKIVAVRSRTSKNGNSFYSVDVEDVNTKKMAVTVWANDYTRFQNELKKDNLVRLTVRPPSGGFYTLLLYSYPRRTKIPPKEEDGRVVVLRPPLPPPKSDLSLSEFTFDAELL